MTGIWTMGEILVEIMRPRPEMALDQPGEFLGPFPSGAPAIFIDTVARLGLPAGMIGGVGADDFGACVLRRLEQDGVDCRGVRQYADGATAVAFVTYFADGSRKFLYHIDGTPAVWPTFQSDEIAARPDFFHVMGCSLMASERFRVEIIKAAEFFCQRGARLSFDPNLRPELLRGRSLDEVIGPVLERCSVLLPGLSELALLSGETEEQAGTRRLFDRYPIDLIVIKRGRKGCRVVPRGGKQIDVASFVVKEVDPTGAGDCFDAGFLAGLVENLPLEGCAYMAAAAGALNAAAFGPMEGQITRERVRAMMETASA